MSQDRRVVVSGEQRHPRIEPETAPRVKLENGARRAQKLRLLGFQSVDTPRPHYSFDDEVRGIPYA
jgi:hypothetical protein